MQRAGVVSCPWTSLLPSSCRPSCLCLQDTPTPCGPTCCLTTRPPSAQHAHANSCNSLGQQAVRQGSPSTHARLYVKAMWLSKSKAKCDACDRRQTSFSFGHVPVFFITVSIDCCASCLAACISYLTDTLQLTCTLEEACASSQQNTRPKDVGTTAKVPCSALSPKCYLHVKGCLSCACMCFAPVQNPSCLPSVNAWLVMTICLSNCCNAHLTLRCQSSVAGWLRIEKWMQTWRQLCAVGVLSQLPGGLLTEAAAGAAAQAPDSQCMFQHAGSMCLYCLWTCLQSSQIPWAHRASK